MFRMDSQIGIKEVVKSYSSLVFNCVKINVQKAETKGLLKVLTIEGKCATLFCQNVSAKIYLVSLVWGMESMKSIFYIRLTIS